jgi:hypothetical protein
MSLELSPLSKSIDSLENLLLRVNDIEYMSKVDDEFKKVIEQGYEILTV